MKTKHNIFALVIIALGLAIAFVVVAGVPWYFPVSAPSQVPGGRVAVTGSTPGNSARSGASTSTVANRMPPLVPHPPHGSQTYEIAQAATTLPGFVQATIDPTDVYVGQVQRFVIVTDDPNPVTSVVAEIQTDHGTTTVALTARGAPAVSMLVPRTVAVSADGILALVTPAKAGKAGSGAPGGNVAYASTTNDVEWTGQWTVRDTHSARYQTIFIAKDSAGNVNTVTLQWTDPCPFATTNNYNGGTATVSGSCDVGDMGWSAVDGPENGNLSITAGTLTINAGAMLVLNSASNTISFGGGTLALPSGSQIVFGQQQCGVDMDGDGYPAGAWTAAASCPSGSVPRSSIAQYYSNTNVDCNDGDPRAHPGATAYQTTQETGTNTTNDPAYPWDFNCDEAVSYLYNASDSVNNYGCNTTCGSGIWCAPILVSSITLTSTPSCGSSFYHGTWCSKSGSGYNCGLRYQTDDCSVQYVFFTQSCL